MTSPAHINIDLLSKYASQLHMVHLPTPGDHYSPATGSAVMTVIYEQLRVHVGLGGKSGVIVSRGTCDGYPPYPVGDVIEADLGTAIPSRYKRAAEMLWGKLFMTRPLTASLYKAVVNVLPRDFSGVLLIHNAPAPLSYLRRQFPHAQLVLYAHNQLFNTYSPREIRNIIRMTDRIVCVSQFIADDLLRRSGMPTDKIFVVYNGIDTQRFIPSKQGDASQALQHAPVILFLGRVVPEKGPDLLVQAAARLAQKEINFQLRIVGSSNFNCNDQPSAYERHLRELAAPLGSLVEFLPFVDRHAVVGALNQADIYVVPSNWDDPCPLTVLEGLSCGKPMVVSRRGGIPEIASDAALYFSPPDAGGLADQLEQLLRDPKKRHDLGCAARRRAGNLTWTHSYEKLCGALLQL